jgi:hypothetical protein
MTRPHPSPNLHPKRRCPTCKLLYWRKHKCQRGKTKSDYIAELEQEYEDLKENER